jgi:hypothetical protein
LSTNCRHSNYHDCGSPQRKGINGDSARNCQLKDEESTERIVILPGITSAGTKNPTEEGDSARNYKLIYKESTWGMGFNRELPAQGC